MSSEPRKYTKRLLSAIDEQKISKDEVIRACLDFMDESDVFVMISENSDALGVIEIDEADSDPVVYYQVARVEFRGTVYVDVPEKFIEQVDLKLRDALLTEYIKQALPCDLLFNTGVVKACEEQIRSWSQDAGASPELTTLLLATLRAHNLRGSWSIKF